MIMHGNPNLIIIDGTTSPSTMATQLYTSIQDTINTETWTHGTGWDIGSGGTVTSTTSIVATTTTGNTASIPFVFIIPDEEAQEKTQRAEANRIKAERERREAIARAETLLKQTLTPIQLLQLKRFGYFFVKGNHTGNRYRIRNGRAVNIDVMQGRNIAYQLCAHPEERCPNQDTMLVQKIMLEHCEQEFLAKAIRH